MKNRNALVALAAVVVALVGLSFGLRERKPDPGHVLVASASRELEAGNYARVIELLTEAQTQKRSVPESDVQLMLGIAQLKLGMLEEAGSSFEATIEQDPRSFRALTLLGGVRKEQGRHDEARDLFQKSIDVRPDYFNAHAGLGSIAFLEGDYQAAVRHLETAADLEPSGRHTWPTLSMAYAYNGQFPEAWRAAEVTRGFDYVEQAELEELIRELEAEYQAGPPEGETP
jgi:tetratricopeptide (TPR) repeat protein